MVYGYVVNAACVNVDVLAKVFHAHGGTFDVPAGIAASPGGIPCHSLIFKFGFGKPKHEVSGVALVFVHDDHVASAFSRHEFFQVKVCEFSVVGVC